MGLFYYTKGPIVSGFLSTTVKTRELSEGIRKSVISEQNNSQGYTAVAKDLQIPASTVHNIMETFHSHKSIKMLPGHDVKKKLNGGWCGLWKNTTQDVYRASGWPGALSSGSFSLCYTLHDKPSRAPYLCCKRKGTKGKTNVCKNLDR